MFKKDDKIKVSENCSLFTGKTGVVLDANENEAKVKLNIDESGENPKYFINIFKNEDLQINSVENALNEEVEDEVRFNNDVQPEEKKEEPKEEKVESCNEEKGILLDQTTLNEWLADHDASYWTQEIKDNGMCPIRGEHGNIIATYNFATKRLTEGYDEHEFPDIDGEHNEDVIPDFTAEDKKDDFLHDYLYDENIDDLNDKVPSWEFVQTIATSEGLDDEIVIQEAIDKGYKMFVVRADNLERLVVAAKGIEAEDIYADYADYLQGNPTVTELGK